MVFPSAGEDSQASAFGVDQLQRSIVVCMCPVHLHSCPLLVLLFMPVVPSFSSPNSFMRVYSMPGAGLDTGPCKVDKVLAFIEQTFQWKVEEKAFR